ncbi:MAG: glycosyltransferase family 4 protein [Chitinophagaceae bacterium]
MYKGKTITILCASFPPETGAGPGRIYLLAQLLQQQGFTVHVIAAMPNYPQGKIFQAYRGKRIVQEQIDGINVCRIWLYPTNSSSKIKRAFSIGSFALSLKLHLPALLRSQQPDLLIVSSPPFILGTFGCSIAERNGVRILLNISDIWPASAQYLGFIREGWLLNYLRKQEKSMYAKASGFSVQSEEIARHILQIRPSADIFIYRNLQHTSAYAQETRPAGKRKIVYAGLLGIAQGLGTIIRQIDFGGAGTELHIYGDGVEQGIIRQEAACRTDIFYHGSIPAHEVPEMLSRYHIMLVPLITGIEGAVPSKIFNAVANGLPLIYMGQGESADIVRAHKLGYTCDPGDFDGLYARLKEMLALNDAEYRQLRNNCRDAAKGIFNKEIQDLNFLKFLHSFFS